MSPNARPFKHPLDRQPLLAVGRADRFRQIGGLLLDLDLLRADVGHDLRPLSLWERVRRTVPCPESGGSSRPSRRRRARARICFSSIFQIAVAQTVELLQGGGRFGVLRHDLDGVPTAGGLLRLQIEPPVADDPLVPRHGAEQNRLAGLDRAGLQLQAMLAERRSWSSRPGSPSTA